MSSTKCFENQWQKHRIITQMEFNRTRNFIEMTLFLVVKLIKLHEMLIRKQVVRNFA